MPIELATIGFEDAERATVATIDGEVDMSNADRLLDELMGRVGLAPWLVVDLTACSYLDSAGLRAVARVDLRCREVGAGLRLVVDPAGAVDRALTMTRMSEVLTVDRSLGDALASAFGDVDGGRANDEGANADARGPDAVGGGP
jgi:anti-anti-sigma factor